MFYSCIREVGDYRKGRKERNQRRGRVACNGEISVSGVLTYQVRIGDGCLAIGIVKPYAYDKAKIKSLWIIGTQGKL